jgi:hypothetical protein
MNNQKSLPLASVLSLSRGEAMARNSVVIRREWARVGRLSSRKRRGEGEELIVFP